MTVHWNKTIQFRQRILPIPLPEVNDSPLCPLTALLQAFDIAKDVDPYGPAFICVYVSRRVSPLELLTYGKFMRKLKLVLTELSGNRY